MEMGRGKKEKDMQRERGEWRETGWREGGKEKIK